MVTSCFLSKTAATKQSLVGLPAVSAPTSFALLGDLDLGKNPFKKMARQAEADFYIAAASGDDGRADLLVHQLGSAPSGTGAKPVLRLVNNFARSEVVELAAAESAESNARAMAVLQRSAKAIVLSRSAQSVNEVLLTAMRAAHANAGVSAQNFYTQCEAVGLESLARIAIDDLAVPAQNTQVPNKELGLPLLLGLSVAVYDWLTSQLSDDDSANDALLAGVDLLAIYGVGFPKWTGGPLSCLSMFQRGELEYSGSQELIAQLQWQFKNELGYKLSAA